jgi:uncharacterized small protein (DUF1192 family)
MTRLKIALGIFAGLCLLALGFGAWQGMREGKEGQGVQKADQHHEAMVVAQAQAVISDQKAEDRKPTLKANSDEVARLKAELAKVKAGIPSDGPSAESVPTYPDLRPVVAAQDQLIQAQDHQIQGLQAQVLDLTSARDSWRTSAKDSQQEAVQLRAALAAKDGLIKGALWKGRIQGFAVGIGSGYGAGRLIR